MGHSALGSIPSSESFSIEAVSTCSLRSLVPEMGSSETTSPISALAVVRVLQGSDWATLQPYKLSSARQSPPHLVSTAGVHRRPHCGVSLSPSRRLLAFASKHTARSPSSPCSPHQDPRASPRDWTINRIQEACFHSFFNHTQL